MIKRIGQGYMIPRFYGIAWIDRVNDQAVCLPLGLNVLAAAARSVYINLRMGSMAIQCDPRDAYRQGLAEGLRQRDRSEPGVEPTRPW